jgi:hypothetical protein
MLKTGKQTADKTIKKINPERINSVEDYQEAINDILTYFHIKFSVLKNR